MAETQRAQAPEGGVPTRIAQAIMLHRAGDREEARNRLALLWDEIGPGGDALHRCTLAHYLADTQDDPWDELDWDLRALEVAEGFVAERAGSTAGPLGEARDAGEPGRRHPVVALRAFFPALHLSLAADYAALGRPAEARAQLLRARASAGALADDADRRGFGEAIDRLALRIDGAAGQSS